VENGINFKMAATGTHPEDLFPGMCSSRVSASHNIHDLHNRYQQGKKVMVAFSQLASYVLLSGVDQTGLGRWSWIQVRTGEHRTQNSLGISALLLVWLAIDWPQWSHER
jgi:hypothetical protein